MSEAVVSSFAGLFGTDLVDGSSIDRVEVPLIQRDYAQGRQDPRVDAVREAFLQVLHDAAVGGEPVGLDFVYGEVADGTLRPLDGQQRLTALFLMHWYLAARTGRIGERAPWMDFSYATRPSARLFCERLVACPLPDNAPSPSVWITEQPWYLYTWRHDPTVQSMLTVLDHLDELFVDDDPETAWHRLVDVQNPAISFHLLPIEDMGSAEDLYIKMNSRGRPLTDFENFKARFEQILDGSPRANEFAVRIDGPWSDLLWPIHGGDNLVDDEFLRYLEFVIELCEWRNDDMELRRAPLIQRAKRVFGTDQPKSAESLDFLFHAFDNWAEVADLPAYFGDLLATQPGVFQDNEPKVVLFGREAIPNLFEACCHGYGSEQRFGSTRKLLLYAVLIHRVLGTEDFRTRLRSLRNLLESSQDELREERLPRIVDDVHRIIINGDLDGVEALNQVQRGDELGKRAFLATHPDLRATVCALEDSDLLRGSLVAFDLDADRLRQRVEAFDVALSTPEHVTAFTGALLATDDYHRTIKAALKFGAPERSVRWRDLLTGASRSDMAATRTALAAVLDGIAEAEDSLDAMEQMSTGFVLQAEEHSRFGWRYYLVKYPVMRSGKSGIYRSADGTMGYSVCMLNREQMNSWYRDPFLSAIVQQANAEAAVVDGESGPWFMGAASNERWLRTVRSDVQMRCIDSGFEIKPPHDIEDLETFAGTMKSRDDIVETDGGFLLAVPQEETEGELVDVVDRVELGSAWLRSVLDAGL